MTALDLRPVVRPPTTAPRNLVAAGREVRPGPGWMYGPRRFAIMDG